MGFFTKTPPKVVEDEDSSEEVARQNMVSVEARLETLAKNRETTDIFEQLAKLPICVILENMQGCQRGLVNAINGMALIEEDGYQGKILELRTLPNSCSKYGGDFFTKLTLDEARKILSIWTVMAKPFQAIDNATKNIAACLDE